MNLLTIVTSKYAAEVEKCISRQFDNGYFKDVPPRCKIERISDLHYLQYFIPDETSIESIDDIGVMNIQRLIGLGIQEVIQKYVIYDIIWNIIHKEYCSVLENDNINEMYWFINKQNISNEINSGDLAAYIYAEVMNVLLESFNNNYEFSIEGFSRFRLQPIYKQLEYCMDDLKNQYNARKEYNKFIDLLKAFIDTQETRVETIHVVGLDDQSFRILDQDKKDITLQCIESFQEDFQGIEMNHEDLLISSLISLVPHNIIFHGYDKTHNKQLVETIDNVFDEKICFCSNCEICNTLQYVHS